MAETVYLLLGSNVGDREQNLDYALTRIRALEGLEVTATSAIYLTEPVGVKGVQPAFLNQAIRAEYQFRPLELLHALEKIELEMGRTAKGKLEPRIIDCDILLFGEQKINEPTLTIPHPRLLERAFALIPLVEIEPHLQHPVTRKPVASYISSRANAGVMLYKDHVARNL
ncbi:2-amino-4-hydroxy-6-hydroxymethyldihydropteridine diphosphokinase [candidate division GN15 bacterium]|uniref:2-amino-4-hydroxy-6-hydroxymethyldihydropteridine diphosphokinase n=1 Tax=candidate division GN15 bacterium TaxID=2072418 RepID=A0A855X3M2_9BACT|nr:MAG: 2-amino-4-hydroxy-6-hydroxymethyldihydropteridine diphosphokinase [candidate division GN15 bacterium]